MRRSIVVLLLAFLVAWMLVMSSVPATEKEEIVFFNTESRKYHCLTCVHAKRCTKNCIELPRSEAKARGGIPCKTCGGTCRLEH